VLKKRKQLSSVLILVLLTATACAALPARGGSGSIALVPFSSPEFGIQGVVPQACRQEDAGNFECTGLTSDSDAAVMVQQSLPASRDELIALLLDQVDLEQLPEPSGDYKGTAFAWDLYAFEAQIVDVGSEILRVDLALAEGDSASYLVALVTVPDVYDANAALFDTVFTHAVYALAPLE
jgi:hypothetical protein